jgi:hypothetical protein
MYSLALGVQGQDFLIARFAQQQEDCFRFFLAVDHLDAAGFQIALQFHAHRRRGADAQIDGFERQVGLAAQMKAACAQRDGDAQHEQPCGEGFAVLTHGDPVVKCQA